MNGSRGQPICASSLPSTCPAVVRTDVRGLGGAERPFTMLAALPIRRGALPNPSGYSRPCYAQGLCLGGVWGGGMRTGAKGQLSREVFLRPLTSLRRSRAAPRTKH